MFKMSIPEITDAELKKRYSRIKPLVRIEGKLYLLREYNNEEITLYSFLWDARENVAREVKEGEFEYIEGSDFFCLHSYVSPAVFSPTIAEVLAQIDKKMLSTAKAFTLVQCPKNIFAFLNNSFTSFARRNGYHVSMVKLYR